MPHVNSVFIKRISLFINSPLDQFEVVSLFTMSSPLLNYFTISLTNLSVFAFLVTFLVLALHLYGNNDNTLIPSRWSIALEAIFASINSIVRDQLGKEQYLPFVYSLFLFILVSNLLGNIPYSYCLTSSIVVAIGLSFTIVVGVTILAISKHGLHFLSFFVPTGTPLALVPLLVLIELVSYTARAFSLGIRLFANMAAGHSLLAILSGFLYKMFTSGLLIGVLSLIPFAVFLGIVGLELAVSFIQSYVFTLLTCSYIKDAIDLH